MQTNMTLTTGYDITPFCSNTFVWVKISNLKSLFTLQNYNKFLRVLQPRPLHVIKKTHVSFRQTGGR